MTWPAGAPMDPAAERPDPIPPIPGFPFLYVGMAAVIVGPTGAGRSSLVQAGAYDAARHGLRVAYLGSEVTMHEFNARAAVLAQRRGDTIDQALLDDLARVRYFDLAATLTAAWRHPDEWTREAAAHFDVLAIDPLAAAASALDLDFDTSNAEFSRFYDRLVQPVVADGTTVLMLDNIGHAAEARKRAKGVSAKADRPDLTFHCHVNQSPAGLAVVAEKVRGERVGHDRGDRWVFDRDTRRIDASAAASAGGGDDAAFRPTFLMEKASRAIEQEPGLTKRAVRDAVGGTAKYVDLALEMLIAEGHVEVRKDGMALRCHAIEPFRQDDEDAPEKRVGGPERVGSVSAPETSERVERVGACLQRVGSVSATQDAERVGVSAPPKGADRHATQDTPPTRPYPPVDDPSVNGRRAVPWHTPPPAPERPATPAEEREADRLLADSAEAAS